MARPKASEGTVSIKVRLKKSILGQLDLEIYNPRNLSPSGKAPYGARSRVIEQALQDYFDKKKRIRLRRRANRDRLKQELNKIGSKQIHGDIK